MANLSEGDIVLCAVERIDGTTVFVKIESGGQGTVVTSEVAPGRIRNLRDYVSVGRKIVCKVLKIDDFGNIHLSLRRVTPKEKKEVLEKYERERNALSILKSVLNEKALETAEKIKKQGFIYDFLQNCKTSPEKLNSFMSKEQAEKVCRILAEKKDKQVEVKKEFWLSSKKPDGIKLTKQVLGFCKGNCDISYLSAGKFTIKIKAANYKEANLEVTKAMGDIEASSKEKKLDFKVE